MRCHQTYRLNVIVRVARAADWPRIARGHGKLHGRPGPAGAGYRRITLWTNDVLASARKIYQAAGFELVEEERHQSFGHDLVGQNWARDR